MVLMLNIIICFWSQWLYFRFASEIFNIGRRNFIDSNYKYAIAQPDILNYNLATPILTLLGVPSPLPIQMKICSF